jgi:hypothetical protein
MASGSCRGRGAQFFQPNQISRPDDDQHDQAIRDLDELRGAPVIRLVISVR